MLHHRNLKDRLQDRRNRLYSTSYATYNIELQYLLQFLHQNHYTRSAIDVLWASSTVDFEEWEAQPTTPKVRFPGSEEGRAKVCYGLLTRCQYDERNEKALKLGWQFGQGPDVGHLLRSFTEGIVDPLINFLYDQIDDASNVLYLIERFKMKVEWFRQKELYSRYTADTSNGEGSLDQELRASLFEEGIDYPFSQPASPSGKADVVALLGTDDPLVLEIKVFDPERSRDKGQLRQGFHQVLRYAGDYNQSVGYLVIFNCSDKRLVISPDDASESDFPPRIIYDGKTFFVVVIDIHPDTVSASKEKPADRIILKYNELISEAKNS